MRVIENFKTFPESMNTSSSDQRFRSYGHWKLGVLPNSVLDRPQRPEQSEHWIRCKMKLKILRKPKLVDN
jgi:hypothetical protein